jgi:hypothetical protein
MPLLPPPAATRKNFFAIVLIQQAPGESPVPVVVLQIDHWTGEMLELLQIRISSKTSFGTTRVGVERVFELS